MVALLGVIILAGTVVNSSIVLIDYTPVSYTHLLGMIGQLQLDTVQNQRDKLAQSIDTLETTRENLGSSVALMCGLDANTIVMPADFETLYKGNLDKMSYNKDLEQAQKNSFLIWQKQDAVRSAYNSYDKNISGTAEAVSYTHLDVYKRQASSLSNRSWSMS